jgi:very-short-patch-repair endonuclease
MRHSVAMSASPLPPHLAGSPFTVSSAEAAAVTPKRLRGRDLDRSVWGVRREKALPDDVRTRCRSFAVRMPANAVFSHATAALLMNAPLPLRLELDGSVDIAVPAPARAPHARGIRGHSIRVLGDDVAFTDGIAHTSPARTWCDLAAKLSLVELVALGDFLVHWRLPLASVDQLLAKSALYAGQPGMARMREAIPLLSDRSESPPESALRVIVVQAALPALRVNYEIVQLETGATVRTDLAFDKYKVLLEYQGDYHRTAKGQWRKDMTRRSRLEADGWIVIELNADDLRDPEELVSRIEAALTRHGWRR